MQQGTTTTSSTGPARPPVARPVAWYDASAIGQPANTPVTVWPDLSGNHYHLTPIGPPPRLYWGDQSHLWAVWLEASPLTSARFPVEFELWWWAVPDEQGSGRLDSIYLEGDGPVCEILFYDRPLNTGEEYLTAAYLQKKWG